MNGPTESRHSSASIQEVIRNTKKKSINIRKRKKIQKKIRKPKKIQKKIRKAGLSGREQNKSEDYRLPNILGMKSGSSKKTFEKNQEARKCPKKTEKKNYKAQKNLQKSGNPKQFRKKSGSQEALEKKLFRLFWYVCPDAKVTRRGNTQLKDTKNKKKDKEN